MSGTLERIKEDLNHAKQYVKSAGSRAKQANDSDGTKKCDEMEKSIEELKEDFGKKGK